MRGRKTAPCPRQPPAGDPGLEKLLRSRTALFPGTAGVPGCATVRRPFLRALREGRHGICASGAGMPSLRMLRSARKRRAASPGGQPAVARATVSGCRAPLPRSERFPVLEAGWLLIGVDVLGGGCSVPASAPALAGSVSVQGSGARQ